MEGMKTINLKATLVAPLLTFGFMASSAMALEITGSDVNMRANANSTSNKVATLAKGTKCDDLGVDAIDSGGTSTNYHSVKCVVDGKEVIGFVKREATDLSAEGFDPKKSGKEMFIGGDGDVNVRSSNSSKENNVIMQIPAGSSVVAFETDEATGMTRVSVNGSKEPAYVSSKLLTASSGPKIQIPTGSNICTDKWPLTESGDLDNNASKVAKQIYKDFHTALKMRKVTTGQWNLTNAEAGSNSEHLGTFAFEQNHLNHKLEVELRSLSAANMKTVSSQNNVDQETLQSGLGMGMLSWQLTKICQYPDNTYVVDLIGAAGAADQIKGQKAQLVIHITGDKQLHASGNLGGFEFEANAQAGR